MVHLPVEKAFFFWLRHHSNSIDRLSDSLNLPLCGRHETFLLPKLKMLKGQKKKEEANKKARFVQPLSSPHISRQGRSIHHVQQNYVVHMPLITPFSPSLLPPPTSYRIFPFEPHARPSHLLSQSLPPSLLSFVQRQVYNDSRYAFRSTAPTSQLKSRSNPSH